MTRTSAISLTDAQREREALAELLSRRRLGPYVSAAEMDERLRHMIDAKHRGQAGRG